MKQFVSILICAVLLFLSLGKSVLVFNYQLNKKAIAEAKCENKDKPQLHCEGKCYLSKQLKNAEEKETPVPNFNQLKELSPYITAKVSTVSFFIAENTHFNWHVEPMKFPIEACPGSVFQPPDYKA